jgi:hypothetical protein
MRWGIAALACGLWSGCSVGSAGYGGDCVRSTECDVGLVCIEGLCTNDLSGLADPGEVPDLSEEDAAAPAIDAAVVDGETPDAALPVLDGSVPVIDAALPLPDATLPVLPDAG